MVQKQPGFFLFSLKIFESDFKITEIAMKKPNACAY